MNCNTVEKTSGFTLVELLIGVVVLGILAMVVVPQFAKADDDAKEANLLATIKLLRQQIALYRVQHNGLGPHEGGGGLGLGPSLTKPTDAAGNIDPNGPYGPYLSRWPANPFSPSYAIGWRISIGVTAKPPRDGTSGWYYDTTTCTISANSLTGGESSDPP